MTLKYRESEWKAQLSNGPRVTWISYLNLSAQRRTKSNTRLIYQRGSSSSSSSPTSSLQQISLSSIFSSVCTTWTVSGLSSIAPGCHTRYSNRSNLYSGRFAPLHLLIYSTKPTERKWQPGAFICCPGPEKRWRMLFFLRARASLWLPGVLLYVCAILAAVGASVPGASFLSLWHMVTLLWDFFPSKSNLNWYIFHIIL